MNRWRVPSLKAVDKHGRVVKDDFGGFVTDARNPRVHTYRVRWQTGPALEHSHSRTFRRDQAVEAERLVARLRDASDRNLEADSRGMPVEPRAAGPAPCPPPSGYSASLIDELTRAFNAIKPRWAEVPNSLTHNRLQLEFCLEAIKSEEIEGLDPSTRADGLTPRMCQDLLVFRREHNRRRPGEEVGISAERGFSVTMALLLDILVGRGLYQSNPWEAAKPLVRKQRRTLVTERMVPTQDEIVDLADKIGSLPGGARYRVPVLAAGQGAFRPAELVGIEASDWAFDSEAPGVRLWRSFPTVSARDSRGGVRQPESPLKHRLVGEDRLVPVCAPLRELVMEHHERFCTSSSLFFSDDVGNRVDLSNWRKRFWNPARDAVFGSSTVPEIRLMPLRWLRKAAITWWLKSGVGVHRAAIWAGNDPEVLLKYYASAHANDAHSELARLEATVPPVLGAASSRDAED